MLTTPALNSVVFFWDPSTRRYRRGKVVGFNFRKDVAIIRWWADKIHEVQVPPSYIVPDVVAE